MVVGGSPPPFSGRLQDPGFVIEGEDTMTTPIPKEEILQSIYQTEGGFCLWVGAGATICLVNRQASVPDWDTLTAEMESLADVSGDMQMTYLLDLRDVAADCEKRIGNMNSINTCVSVTITRFAGGSFD